MPAFFAFLTMLALFSFDGAASTRRVAFSALVTVALAAATVLLWLVQEGRL